MRPSFITFTEEDLRNVGGVCPICDNAFEPGDFLLVLRPQGQYVKAPPTMHQKCIKAVVKHSPMQSVDKKYNRLRADLARGATPLAVYVDEGV